MDDNYPLLSPFANPPWEESEDVENDEWNDQIEPWELLEDD